MKKLNTINIILYIIIIILFIYSFINSKDFKDIIIILLSIQILLDIIERRKRLYKNLSILIISILLFSNCKNNENESNWKATEYYKVIKIDNCEYICAKYNSKFLIHKYNCNNNIHNNINLKSYQIQLQDSTCLLYDNSKLIGRFKIENELKYLIDKDNQ